MKYRILLPLLFSLSLFNCASDKADPTQDGEKLYQVVLFLNPDCPLCHSYSYTISTIQAKFKEKIFWKAVFPGKWIQKSAVDSFLSEYQLQFDIVVMDSDLQLANTYSATITPSAFITDAADVIYYSGRINDWAIETGKKKLKPSAHDLENAIEALLNEEEIKVKETTAIGCLIE